MVTFISFLLTLCGCINWLMIGFLQYDFIAGLFGFQGSIFSRIIYILFGLGAAYLVIRVIANKGSLKVFERKRKKEKQETNPQIDLQTNNVAHQTQQTQEETAKQ